ncbi:hypothetical protein M406DRAFT_66954 [Cryphonectria parasitica EP155]|uniref:Uncharacterized protein n=1 Tax=Cryphonectria parasitica (strain ATCC 38755 / EP155) TaxID=660469 RepID=A0A9P4YCH5_CRYP1|nr:uncharacterized protein M406DRAFT_66954 [Cryphonectria parasitica EP155]KAF3770558.1 hypothetical protein M406DRAFT_66954 [Cryphonectria parasitica EP155]
MSSFAMSALPPVAFGGPFPSLSYDSPSQSAITSRPPRPSVSRPKSSEDSTMSPIRRVWSSPVEGLRRVRSNKSTSSADEAQGSDMSRVRLRVLRLKDGGSRFFRKLSLSRRTSSDSIETVSSAECKPERHVSFFLPNSAVLPESPRTRNAKLRERCATPDVIQEDRRDMDSDDDDDDDNRSILYHRRRGDDSIFEMSEEYRRASEYYALSFLWF